MDRTDLQHAGPNPSVGPTGPIEAARAATGEPTPRYINRELSWLDFNERVLAMAERADLPLLERVRFLAIFHTNLDEFFQVRVAGLLEQVAAGMRTPSFDGLTPSEQLERVRSRVIDAYGRQSDLFAGQLVPALEKEGIRIVGWDDLSADDRRFLDAYFAERVYPVLTPLAVDPAHPFPYISNLSLNLGVTVRDPRGGEARFARVKVPPLLPRFVPLPDGERFLPLERLILARLDRLFSGMEVVDAYVFRVTRNADLEVEEDEADDLLRAIESELSRRRFGRVVRLEVEPGLADDALALLVRELKITPEEVYRTPGPLGLADLWAFTDLRPDLRLEPWTPVVPQPFVGADQEQADLFEVLRRRDVLVQHPYESFHASVARFIDEAAHDPRVLAIKQTVYRTSSDSPIVRSLIEAAEEGKQVVALVELKARFDEERNIAWARRLEEAGVHVVYGLVGLKTHAKTTLVVREDEDGAIRRYAHIGTGNYNERTARMYEDIGLFTSAPDIGADLTDVFNFLTGYARQDGYRRLLVAPTNLRPRILSYIEREIEAGTDGSIVMKMNALVDPEIIEALYRASQAGVSVDLIPRSICCLRPGVPGMSEGIRVRSVVGRYLEHSRIYRFGSEGRGFDYLIGSADMMPRNLDRRVEVVTPVLAPTLQDRLEEILAVLLADDQLAWELGPDGTWHRVVGDDGIEAHTVLEELALHRNRPGVAEGEQAPHAESTILAAGGVVLRHGTAGPEVALIHRKRYGDWSFPKGKLDPGESFEAAALREVEEETGISARLEDELPSVAYRTPRGNPKLVRYWRMTPEQERRFAPNHEVDEVRWVPVPEARDLLTYRHDRDLLDAAVPPDGEAR